jgi:DNA-binding GntR family transcriptional regulator
LPIEIDPATPLTDPSLDASEDASLHRRITADLRGAIACGALQPGDLLPTLMDIATST